MELKIFLITSLYILDKNSSQQTLRQMRYEKNKSLSLDVVKNGHIFSLNVCHFQYDHWLFFSRKMENIISCNEKLTGKI